MKRLLQGGDMINFFQTIRISHTQKDQTFFNLDNSLWLSKGTQTRTA